MPQYFPSRFRSAILARFIDTSRFVGIDGYAILRDAGIDPRWLEDPEAWIPAESVAGALEQGARVSGRDDFAILLADSQSLASLGPAALVLEHELTARQIVMAGIEFRPAISDAILITFKEEDDVAVMSFEFQTQLPSAQLSDFVVAVATAVLVDATGGRWHPISVHFRHPRPRLTETFSRYFGCPAYFGEEFDGWTCNRSDLDIANPAANALLATYARRLLNLTPEMSVAETFRGRVASSIQLLLAHGHPTLGRVAANLGLSPRSLQRGLAKEGHSFNDVLNRVRRNVAARALAQSARPVHEVAYGAGFTSPSSFSRWFRQEFKQSPTQWRSRSLNS